MAEFLHSFVYRLQALGNHSFKIRIMSMKYVCVAVLLLFISSLSGQNTDTLSITDESLIIDATQDTIPKDGAILTKETTTKIQIADPSMEDWKSGKSKFPPKPKDMWE